MRHAEEKCHSPAGGDVVPAPFDLAAAHHQGLMACAPQPCQGTVGITSTSLVSAHCGETQDQPEEEKEGLHAKASSQPLPGRG